MVEQMEASPLWKNRKRSSKHVLVALGWNDYSILEGICHYAHRAGWRLDNRIIRSGYVPDKWEGDGIIALAGDSTFIRRLILNSDLPTVSVGKEDVPSVDVNVFPDDQLIGEMGADYFLDKGFREHVVMHTSAHPIEVARFRAYEERVRQAGATVHHFEWIPPQEDGSVWGQSCLDWTMQCLSSISPPFAVFSHNDDDANRVMEACAVLRLLVPEQVCVLGVNNNQLFCGVAQTPLSSIDPDLKHIGEVGAECLDRLMESNPKRKQAISIAPSHICERLSTRMKPSKSLEAALAYTYIQNHYSDSSLNAEKIAVFSSVSKSKLFALYREAYGHSIADEIALRRIAGAKELFATTELKVNEVQHLVGINDAETFSRFFKRHSGVTVQGFKKSLAKTT